MAIVERGAAALDTTASDGVKSLIAERAGGDARAALQILELAHETARAEDVPLAESHVARRRAQASAPLRPQGRPAL